MHPNIESKVAVVTGASRGIGYRIAERLLAEGAVVMICSREPRGVDAALRELRRISVTGSRAAQRASAILAEGPRVEGAACDVRSSEQVERLMSLAEEKFGGIDILVNNAGIGIFRSVDRLTPQEWDAVIGTNLTGAFYCVRAAAPRMKKRGGGYIFNISSLAGKNAFAGGSAYNASKAGLNAFSEAMMLDLRYDNIRTSYIMPGSVETDFGGEPGSSRSSSWKLSSGDVAQCVIDLLKSDPHAMLSRVEMRPSQPPRK